MTNINGTNLSNRVSAYLSEAYESAKEDYTLEKVSQATYYFFHALASFALSPFKLLISPLVFSGKNQQMRDEIEKAQIKSLKTSLYLGLVGINRGIKTENRVVTSYEELKQGVLQHCNYPWEKREGETGELAQGVIALREKIEELESGEGFRSGRVEEIRNELKKLTRIPLYLTLKDLDCAAVNFIQFVAIKLLAADGNRTLEKHGRKYVGYFKEPEVTPGKLAASMKNYLNHTDFSKDEIGEKGCYFISHPIKAWFSSVSGRKPLKFDAGRENPNFSAHAFEFGGKKITFYYGPSITGSPIFEHAVLPAYRKFGGRELRFEHQTTTKKSDLARIQEATKVAERNKDVLTHAVIGFDVKLPRTDFKSSDEFFKTFDLFVMSGVRDIDAAHYKYDNGYYITNDVLTKPEIEEALLQARNICRILTVGNPEFEKSLSDEEGKDRVRKMMKLVTDASLSLAILKRSFSKVQPVNANLDPDLTALRMSGACKQDIDRGVVENIALYLFSRWTENKTPLTREEGYKIAGGVLGRAHIVEGRKIMRDRFEVLEDFLRFTDGKVQKIGEILFDSSSGVRYPQAP